MGAHFLGFSGKGETLHSYLGPGPLLGPGRALGLKGSEA